MGRDGGEGGGEGGRGKDGGAGARGRKMRPTSKVRASSQRKQKSTPLHLAASHPFSTGPGPGGARRGLKASRPGISADYPSQYPSSESVSESFSESLSGTDSLSVPVF